MSLPARTTITCPNCGRMFQTTIFSSINTDYSPDLAKSIISGELFDAICPKCGNAAHMEYDVLYNDMKHHCFIYVVHKDDLEYEDKIRQLRKSHVFGEINTRLVNDMNALREKVACLESGKDDRVIELYKLCVSLQLALQKPNFKFRNAFYTYAEGKDIVFIYDIDGTESCYLLDEELYNQLFNNFNVAINQMENTPYQLIDSDWAQNFIREHPANSVEEDGTEPEIPNTSEREDGMVQIGDCTKTIMYCRKCGEKLLPDSVFCSYCGTKVIPQ